MSFKVIILTFNYIITTTIDKIKSFKKVIFKLDIKLVIMTLKLVIMTSCWVFNLFLYGRNVLPYQEILKLLQFHSKLSY